MNAVTACGNADWTIAIFKTSPCRRNNPAPIAEVAGPIRNRRTKPYTVKAPPHDIILSCNAMKSPVLNMAIPLPALAMIKIESSTMLGILKCHLIAMRAQIRPRKHA
nr:hypothetical protein Iba_chr12bCG7450 [Ipomoea batatas]